MSEFFSDRGKECVLRYWNIADIWSPLPRNAAVIVYQNSPPTKDWTSKKKVFCLQKRKLLSEGQTFRDSDTFPLWKFKTHFSKGSIHTEPNLPASQHENCLSGVRQNVAGTKINICVEKNRPKQYPVFAVLSLHFSTVTFSYSTRRWKRVRHGREIGTARDVFLPPLRIRGSFVRVHTQDSCLARGVLPAPRDIRFASRETFHRVPFFGNPGLKRISDSPSLALGFGTLYSETKRPPHCRKKPSRPSQVLEDIYAMIVPQCCWGVFGAVTHTKATWKTRTPRWKRNASLARISLALSPPMSKVQKKRRFPKICTHIRNSISGQYINDEDIPNIKRSEAQKCFERFRLQHHWE